MGGTIVTLGIVLDVPGNLPSPCLISMTISNRFRSVELIAFAESSESTFVLPVFLNVTNRIVHFRVPSRYTTSSLLSCCGALIGESASLSSVAKSNNESLILPSHSPNLSRISRIRGLLRSVFNLDWVP